MLKVNTYCMDEAEIFSVLETESKIVYIKKSKTKSGYVNVYWNNKNCSLILGSKNISHPVASITEIIKPEGFLDDKDRLTIQIGDSICYLFNTQLLPLLCCTVVGFKIIDNKIYAHLMANSPHCIDIAKEMWVLFEEDRFIFVSSNTRSRKKAEKNEIYAYYQDELEMCEQIYSSVRVPQFVIEKVKKKSYALNYELLLACHFEIFSKIYSWAGKIREHEVVVVVGRKEHPTLPHADIFDEISLFFKKCAYPSYGKIAGDKRNLTKVLVMIHKNLAAIHPFEDGNGRAIRLFLFIAAFKYNFLLMLEPYIKKKKNKRYYHYAVKSVINGNDVHLYKIIYNSLSDLNVVKS